MDLRYPPTFEPQKDGSFFVQFVDLPDTFTEGRTEEEALFNAAEVLSAMLAWRLDEAKDVPAPSANCTKSNATRNREPPRSAGVRDAVPAKTMISTKSTEASVKWNITAAWNICGGA